MRIGVIGAGRIGGNAARLFAQAGHEVLVSFSRDPQKLDALAAEIGGRAGTPREAVAFGDVVMLAVSWTLIDDVLAQAGPLDGKIVIDTTNQFGREGWEDLGDQTAAQVNAARMPGARYTKAFNTLTSGFQPEAAGRTGADRVVMFLCGDDDAAKRVVGGLIDDAGFTPSTWAPWPTRRRWRRHGATARSTARRSTSSRRGTSSRAGARHDACALRMGGRGRSARPAHAVLLPSRPRRPDPGAPCSSGCRRHPHHVALWLGEVFGGPAVYTEEHGGYPHMLAKHLGLALTEEQRARWVALITPAADDAGLPGRSRVPLGPAGLRRMGHADRAGQLAAGRGAAPEAPVPSWGWGEAPPYQP